MVLLDDIFSCADIGHHFLNILTCYQDPCNFFNVSIGEVKNLVALSRSFKKARTSVEHFIRKLHWYHGATDVFSFKVWVQGVNFKDLRTAKFEVVGGIFKGNLRGVDAEEMPSAPYNSPVMSPAGCRKQKKYCIHKSNVTTSMRKEANRMKEEHWSGLGHTRIFLDGKGPYCPFSSNVKEVLEYEDKSYYQFSIKAYTGVRYTIRGQLRVKMDPPKVITFVYSLEKAVEDSMTDSEIRDHDDKTVKKVISLLTKVTDVDNIHYYEIVLAGRYRDGVLMGRFHKKIKLLGFSYNPTKHTLVNNKKQFMERPLEIGALSDDSE